MTVSIKMETHKFVISKEKGCRNELPTIIDSVHVLVFPQFYLMMTF